MSKLVVCEKPSVAMSIAKVLGARERRDGYLEGDGYIVSWCVGHLVELAAPGSYDERYTKWRKEDLPHIAPAVAVSGIIVHEEAIWDSPSAYESDRCGEPGLRHRRRA